VQSVALTSNVPFQSPKWTPRILLADDPADAVRPNIAGYAITPGYLNLVGTEVLSGRNFGPQDGPGGERVVLVNETFVRTMLGRASAVGSTVFWSAGTEWSVGDEWMPPAEWLAGKPAPMRIVGVVEDVVQLRLGDAPRPAIYIPYTQSRPLSPTAVLRAGVPLAAFESGLRAAVARFNPKLSTPVDLAPMVLAERRVLQFQAALIAGFAAMAILLAASGLYGSMLHFVAIRRREFGVRIALGSTRYRVFAFVLREGALVSVAGLAVGMFGILLFGKLLSGFLFGVSPTDASTLFASGALLVAVAAIACIVPAHRATTVEPSTVLRADT
jgi:putative ABC transport system permease protein